MTKVILRISFILVCTALGYRFYPNPVVGFNILGSTLGLSASLLVVAVEVGFSRRFLEDVPVVMLGLVFGFIVANLFIKILFLLPIVTDLDSEWRQVIMLSIIIVSVYLAVGVILHTKDDFKFVIPYVEFSRQSKGSRAMILDTSVIIDGRIADICDTKVVDSQLIIPRFVLDELQQIADSSDRIKRKRGRRGLDILHRLQKSDLVETRISESAFPGVREVDAKLLLLAEEMDGKLVTNDFNLNKVAKLQDIDVVNINDLATALRPVVLPGEEMTIELIRAGEEAGQGVGYLDDGTMVVVDNARDLVGQTVAITTTSVLQTSAGKMIFGKPKKG